MIIWNGWGFLVAVFVFVCSLIANLITDSVAGEGKYWDVYKWPLALAFIVAGILSWILGRYLAKRKARVLIDKETGKEVVLRPLHALFFIEMRWWGPILAVIAVIILIIDIVQ
jgi:hypothetical protein